MKKAKGRIICKVYYYVLKIIIMFVWALTESGRIHKKLVANVTSGERNWKPEVKSEGDLTFHCLLFHIFNILYHKLILPGGVGRERNHHLLCLPRTTALPTGFFLARCPDGRSVEGFVSTPWAVKSLPPTLLAHWKLQPSAFHHWLPTQTRNPRLPF